MLSNSLKISHLHDDAFMNHLFPFYIILDKDLCIKKTGLSLDKILATNIKGDFINQFEIERPLNCKSFNDIIKYKSALFILKSKTKDNFKLRGEFYCDETHELLCFLGGPLIKSFEEMTSLNLNLNDFATHDNVTQFLFALQAQFSATKDSQALTEKLQNSNKNLESINESLDSFTYRLTHDLRAPTVNLFSMLKMLEEALNISPESKAYTIFNHAQNATDKLLETIEDFLELAKAEKEGLLKKEVCNISQITNEIIDSLKQIIDTSNAIITTDFAIENMFFIKEDLKSIILNLVSNSLKYKSEKRFPEVTIKTLIKGDVLELTIADNCIGIDLGIHKEKMFKMFNRFHVSSEIGGTGIGLYLVKKLTEKNKGKITVESELDKGSKFTLNFPIK